MWFFHYGVTSCSLKALVVIELKEQCCYNLEIIKTQKRSLSSLSKMFYLVSYRADDQI